LNNAQTFSQNSDRYAKYRPSYPDELFLYLSDLCQGHESVWDCATGNGQAAISCAKYFLHIEATDISPEQIRNAMLHPQITYSVSSAESAQFGDNSFDMIMVAQALHWFNLDRFHQEAQRVLKPNGILAIFGYAYFQIDPDIDAVITDHLFAPIDRFWAPENRLLMSGYRDMAIPFHELPIQREFTMNVEWTLPQLLEYFRTWSAVKRFVAQEGNDPVSELEPKIKPLWKESDTVKRVKMPLFLRASRKLPG